MGKKIPKGVNEASDIADFLFATKSIERIAKGAGSWGDLIDVGITAASFFIPPLRLAKLPAGALTKVITSAEKVVTSDVASVAAKRAAAKTMDDALTMKRQGYIPTGEEPVQRVGRAGLGEPTPAYQVAERTTPTPAALAERGKVSKEYTRTPDEEYDPFKRDLDVEQEADDAINSKFGGYIDRETKRYVGNPKRTKEQKERALIEDARKVGMYDKTKFTQEEIEDRIAGLSKKELESPGLKRKEGESAASHRQRLEEYIRGGDVEDLTPVPFASTTAMRKTGEYTDEEIKKSVDTFRRYVKDPAIDRDAKEVIALYAAARRMLKTIKVNSQNVPEDRRISRADLKVIKQSFMELRKEFKEKVLKTAEGKALLKQLEKEMPSNPNTRDVLLRYEESLADDAKPGELKALIDEAMDDTPIAMGKGAMQVGKVPVKIKAKVPDDILDAMSKNGKGLLGKESPMYQEELKFAELLIERSKLNAFNASNATKLKTAKPEEVSKIKQSTARNKKILSRIDDEIAELRDDLREGFSVRLQKLADEVTKRNLAKRSEKYGPFEGPIKLPPARPGKGGETAKLTREGRIAKAEAEMERLREEWTKLPDTDVKGREKLKQEAKKFADYIEKMGGTVKPTVAKSVDTPKPVKPVDSPSAALKPINSFRGENAFLSNMSESSFKVGQDSYPTVEHFFQAMKTTDKAERAKILAAKTPAEAKRIGKTVTLRKNWNQIREEVMETGLRAKFMQNPELKKKLLETKDADLIEGNTWGDTFWGQVDGKGQNKLGKLLMKIRDELMKGK